MERRSEGLLGWFDRCRKAVACTLVLALSPFMVGCYGPFVLTKAVFDLNRSVGLGIFQQIVFWVFLAVPVYSIALLGDLIVVNLIDFWTGVPGGMLVRSNCTRPRRTPRPLVFPE